MKKHIHRCPVSWSIGQFFFDKRVAKNLSQNELAQMLEVSTEYIDLFEHGKIVIDILFVLKLEKLFNVPYKSYKPLVSYHGFIGFDCDKSKLLFLNKRIIKELKKTFSYARMYYNIEDTLLNLRYAPLRGKRLD